MSADSAALLHGVDISPKMIEIAGKKGLYDALLSGDIHVVLNDLDRRSYDLIIAADVFTYIGDIRPASPRHHTVLAAKNVTSIFPLKTSTSRQSGWLFSKAGDLLILNITSVRRQKPVAGIFLTCRKSI